MEKLNNIVRYLQAILLKDIINSIPKNGKLSRKKIVGTIVFKSPEFIAEKYNISRCLYFDKYNDLVIDFTNILEKNFSHCNLSSFYKNMETLIIKDKVKNVITLFEKFMGTKAYYDHENNKVQLINFDILKHYLYHELLHMASSRQKNGKVILSGFSQFQSNKRVGEFLNEGYTEYLNLKYFSQENSKENQKNYKKIVLIAQSLERIVGAEKMEKLYFDANLQGLIDELAKYCSEEVVVNLINKIDCYCKKIFGNKIYDEIIETIANIYKNKLLIDLTEEKITKNEYQKKKLLYYDDFKNGRINSENVEVEEYDEYFLIIDHDKHESHFYMKNSEEVKKEDKRK